MEIYSWKQTLIILEVIINLISYELLNHDRHKHSYWIRMLKFIMVIVTRSMRENLYLYINGYLIEAEVDMYPYVRQSVGLSVCGNFLHVK